MSELFAPGDYRFLPLGQFSSGVRAEPGFALRRVRFLKPLPIAVGLALARSIIEAAGRPAAALAACELRSPLPLPRDEFLAFNDRYLAALLANGFPGHAPFPIGRSNLAPILSPPVEPVLFAVTFTVPARDAGGRDYLISGKPESSPQGVIGGDDVSDAGMVVKAEFVMAELRARVAELGVDWSAITGAQCYTVRPLEPVLRTVLADLPLAWGGLTLVPAHPPVTGLYFEVDIRSVFEEGFA